jgi:hypothetical protein
MKDLVYKGTTLQSFIDFHLTGKLKGVFHIYKNIDNKYHYKSDKCKINIDLNFWKYVKTINI